ncbi:MAG TPA: hypothetical protein PLM53_13440 [Spirochaetota bacterium]|nr:hypothetical protein [Spirochaetota bacterium]HPL15815.1 hypothetical protein [Spirochaetota bacterium]HQF06514.1 hypothetical protein [Spirochaetota bacterium]HQH98099.1 hypothetical protein [Spirochaetota bacterium]HQJ70757.1 hypothetical protein [Spirochaetota bacterium]
MIKQVMSVCCCVVVFSVPLFPETTSVGYKEFALGQTKEKIRKEIKGAYNKVSYSANGDMTIETGEMTITRLFFDQQEKLYLIQVEIKWGEIAKVKERLIDKYGQPNDFRGEEFDRSTGSFLMAKWSIDKRYSISAWETEDCRKSKVNPCVIYVEYLDINLKDAKIRFEQKKTEEAQKKKEGKTYDGF